MIGIESDGWFRLDLRLANHVRLRPSLPDQPARLTLEQLRGLRLRYSRDVAHLVCLDVDLIPINVVCPSLTLLGFDSISGVGQNDSDPDDVVNHLLASPADEATVPQFLKVEPAY